MAYREPFLVVPPPDQPRIRDSFWACTGTLKNGMPCIFWAYDDVKASKHRRRPQNHPVIQIEIPPEGPSPWRAFRPGVLDRVQADSKAIASLINMLFPQGVTG